jgi:hypothetical protein
VTEAEEPGIIGRAFEDGSPVIFKLVNELPPESTRTALPWLTVISWKYDGSSNNGMPAMSVNEEMVRLERAIENSLLRESLARHAYSRTGNGLKELVYYVSGRDEFMAAFNDALNAHPPYPIEITFYNDAEWKDLRDLLETFRQDK